VNEGIGDPTASSTPAFIEVSAALILGTEGLLITRRPRGSHLAGLWEFPGGKREKGETFAQGLVREIEEELGVEIEVEPWAYAEIEHRYPEKHVHLKFFRARIRSGIPRLLGCDEIAWAGKSELSSYSFPAADTALLAQLERDISFWIARDAREG